MKKQEVQDSLALDINNVSKTYYQLQRGHSIKESIHTMFRSKKKEISALKDLTFQVHEGEFVSYAGANGAGKSTTIKILSGILRPTSGRVSVLGMSPEKNRVEIMKKMGVIFGQRTELWWDHPVNSSYEWKKVVWNIPEKEYQENLDIVVELLDLKGIINTFARELSLGQRMRADIGMLLLSSPKLILLDEPTLGLDILSKRKTIQFLKYLNKEKKTTIVVTSHDMSDLEEMSNRIILLSNGSAIFDGSFELLRKVRSNKMKLVIECDNVIQNIPGLSLIESDGDKHTYEIIDEQSLQKILGCLSTIQNVKNIELKKGSIEDLISNYYDEERHR